MKKIKNYIINLLFILIIFTFSPLCRAGSRNSLWEVKTDNNTVYLLGSVHFFKKENYPLSKPIEKAFQKSQVIVFETDLEKMNNPETQQLILQKGMLPKGKTIKDMLDSKTYKLLSAELESFEIPIAGFQNFKPWFLVITISVLKIQSLGYNMQDGIDYYFFNKAKEQGKEIRGLETLQEQLAHLDILALLDQNDLLRQAIEEMSDLEKEFKNIIEAWTSGDTDKMEEIVLKSFKKYPEIYKRLLIDRNKKWMSKINSFLKKDKNYMIIVGAGHLIGKKSVIELLKAKGYSVKQL